MAVKVDLYLALEGKDFGVGISARKSGRDGGKFAGIKGTKTPMLRRALNIPHQDTNV